MNLFTPIPIRVDVLEETNQGVRALWVRVIIRALCDFVTLKDQRGLKNKREFRAVKNWLFDDRSSLPGICMLIDLNIQIVRQRALEMTPKDIRKFEHKSRDTLPQKRLPSGDCR